MHTLRPLSATLLIATLLTPLLVTSSNLQPIHAQTLSTAARIYQQASASTVTIKNGKGHGSGFIISLDGLILTNAHVVANGPRIVTVLFNDGRQAAADLIGFAKNGTDLAVLRLYNQKIQSHLTLAPPQTLNVGQPLYVIGTPLDEHYRNTLSEGIISRLDLQRGILQHSANTNPGSSGGPVLNSHGQVIGVIYGGDIQSPVYDAFGQAVARTKSGINFAVSLDRILAFQAAIQTNQLSPVSTLPSPKPQSTEQTITLNGSTIQKTFAPNDPQLNSGNFFHRYSFLGKAGQVVTIDLRSKTLNPVLTLYQIKNTKDGPQAEIIVTKDDNGPNDFNATLTTTLPANGIYFIQTSPYNPRETGAYSLQVATQ
jgi:serine protease Do